MNYGAEVTIGILMMIPAKVFSSLQQSSDQVSHFTSSPEQAPETTGIGSSMKQHYINFYHSKDHRGTRLYADVVLPINYVKNRFPVADGACVFALGTCASLFLLLITTAVVITYLQITPTGRCGVHLGRDKQQHHQRAFLDAFFV